MGEKYVGMDVHQSNLVIEVINEKGVCQMQTNRILNYKGRYLYAWCS